MSFGSHIHAPELLNLLDLHLEHRGWPPLCIWGAHGIGKTEIVRDFARSKRVQFQYLAPAQFEELGDLLGMPAIVEGQTMLRPPSWAPTASGPGILLLDDLNRADDRILRGLMPLLQGYGMVSWKLPPSWRIVCTANPDDGSYSVSTLDPAIMTRLMHVHLEFDATAWSQWARERKIHERDIQFVMAHPELLNGEQTTARTLAQFFQALSQLPDKELPQIKLLGDAFLDPAASQSYLEHYEQWEIKWIQPKKFLTTREAIQKKKQRLDQFLEQGPRVQSAFARGLLNILNAGDIRFTEGVQQHLLVFLRSEHLNKAFRLQFIRDLANLEKESIQEFVGSDEVLEVIGS